MESAFNRLTDSPLKLAGVTVSIATIGYVLAQGFRRMAEKSNKLPSPPGPPRHFLIGSLLQFPNDHFYQRDIVSVELPGISMVIINSYDIAQELMIKRPNNTAGRKVGYMFFEVDIGNLVIEVAHGTKLPTMMDKDFTSWNLEAMEFGASALTSFWVVDIFNFLRFIPKWMPAARFKSVISSSFGSLIYRRMGARSTWLNKQVRHVPFEMAKALHKSGELGHCLANDLLDEFGPNDDTMEALGVLYLAGSDTTTAAVMAFINALMLFPEVSKKAYEEVVRVTDGIRLPRVSDRPNLPYIEAVWKEAFRWKSFFPMGIPHVNAQDEIINGYLIKAGSVLNPNTGFMLSDPKVWGDPENFRPERFLMDGADLLPNPLTVTFGYGMRVCAGMHLADRTGFHIGATIAALYGVAPLEGKRRLKPELAEFTDTFIRLPVGFEGRFIPRDKRVLDLLRIAEMED
ncbi:hypothetical protein M408DRAFT_30764 [Serendipita vermifera MAFF 305830]|uniref:Cytochrome P450 n=1 Tax=Serendipita vermifera MAFF 305830 TaxID=933852 RepID=A0A0C3AL00_SERVB|nr:hypothetical protein M408DRAFT_30764 [Serendipita vermifera MAFF 305830]